MNWTTLQVAEKLGVSRNTVLNLTHRGVLRDASGKGNRRHEYAYDSREVAEYLKARRNGGNGNGHVDDGAVPLVLPPPPSINPLGALARIEDALARLARQSPPVTTDTDHLIGTLASMTLALNRIEAQLELLLAAWK